VFTTSVINVSLLSGNKTVYLSGKNLTDWAENSSWTFHLPDGRTIVAPTGPSASLPSGDYLTINGTNTAHVATVVVTFSNPSAAFQVVVSFTANELCASSGTGSAGTTISPSWP